MFFVLAVHALWHRAAMAEGGCPKCFVSFYNLWNMLKKFPLSG